MLIANPKEAAKQERPQMVKETRVHTLNAVKYEMVEGEIIKTKVGKCFPTDTQEVLAESLLQLLMAQIAHDGSWRMVWRDPVKTTWDKFTGLFRPWKPTVLQCQFLDEDGDIWFVVNIEENEVDAIEKGVSHWVAECEQAYQWTHNLLFGVMNLNKERDMKKQAKGEAMTPIDVLPPQTGAV